MSTITGTTPPSSINPAEKIKAEVSLYQSNREKAQKDRLADIQKSKNALEQQFSQLNVAWTSTQDPLRKETLGKQKNEAALKWDNVLQLEQQLVINA